jgi:single-strand DNA-binding protein
LKIGTGIEFSKAPDPDIDYDTDPDTEKANTLLRYSNGERKMGNENFVAQFSASSLDMRGELKMGTLNKVLLIGRLGKDPDERTTAGGLRVSNFSVATDVFHGNNGDKTTEWHRIVVFGKTAELCNQYLRKGKLVCIEGSLQTRSWEKPPGEKHFMTEVIGSRITFLDHKDGNPKAPLSAEEDSDPF